MTKNLLFLNLLMFGLFLHSKGQTELQCDSIKIYNGNFDNTFQNLYQSIDSDSILAVRYCGSTNGCANSFGILFWKKDNKYFFKKIQSNGKRFKSSDKVRSELKSHLRDFYNTKLYKNKKETPIDRNIWIDDGELTLILFRAEDICWRYTYVGIYGDEDEKVKWIKKLILIMNK